MKWWSVISLYILAIPLLAGGIDYCHTRCAHRHIGCANDGRFGAECPEDVRVLDLERHKELILRLHNDIRAEVALGRKPLRPAARMAEMQWNDQLAQLALLTAKTCNPRVDECRSTDTFPHSGQNIGRFSYSEGLTGITEEQLIKERTQAWLENIDQLTEADIAKYPRRFRFSQIATIINERNQYVGCGAVRFTKSGNKRFIIVCNYAHANIVGQPVYTVAQTAGRRCRAKSSTTYGGLCSTNEVYSSNENAT